jgi:two-component system, NtrC family, response regulator HydG
VNGALVLVADDEAGMRETLVDILEQHGYTVCSAEDGEAALSAIRQKPFDVALMDVRMPRRDGVSVLREVGNPPPRIILMTAYAHSEQLEQARQSNVYAVVSKPFRVPELLGLVSQAAGAAA